MAILYGRRGTNPGEIDISDPVTEPFGRLSPAYLHGDVPIPGRFNLCQAAESADPDRSWSCADSVQGVREGLKIIAGQTDESRFRGPPGRRAGVVEGYYFGYRTLSEVESRCLLTIPSYLGALHRCGDLLQRIRERGCGGDIHLVDECYAPDPFALEVPLSPGRLLVDYLNGALECYEQARARLRAHGQEHARLHESVDDDNLGTLWPRVAELMKTWEERTVRLYRPERRLDTYEDWAARYEREELITYIASCAGVSELLEPLARSLARWVAMGMMSPAEARRLSQYAPFTRFVDDWYGKGA